MAVSMNGWKVDPLITRITAAGKAAWVRRGDVARLIRWLGIAYALEVEPLLSFNGWRSAALNASTGTPVQNSNHRSATAIDINGGKYPYEYTHRPSWKDPVPAAIKAKIRKVLVRVPEIGWGADFASPYRDPMHYEIRNGVSAAKIKARLDVLGVGWWHVHQATTGNAKACLYKTRETGKANITRRRGIGRNLYIVYVTPDRVWAMTKKGDWIKTSKLTKGKK
ncbi:hypothetical protein GCM10010401_07500 [Rarobacter faecitabidus]|uniref:D-alanyl-D-alanine carboxypeptidase-like protein n=1 Tax=Rarobacter faecitabidus TaxID=13243 RepID=A0A542ZAI6_RARFA|nr:M15 family metallopeptidase [Rarobacter faecitabidus]TQL57359.1 D-alanyl-D-alanine carboxypeptidase-like protein [Rarobacter faecitabidus]